MHSLHNAISKIKRVGTKGKHDKPDIARNGSANGANSAKDKASITTPTSVSSSELNVDGEPLSKNQTRKKTSRKSHRERNVIAEQRKAEAIRLRKEADAKVEAQEPAEVRAKYGEYPLVQSIDRKRELRVQLRDVSAERDGEVILFRARVHALRKMSANLAFFVFRQQLSTIQGVLAHQGEKVSTHMVQWAERVQSGSIVLVKGTLQKPKEPVKGSTIHDIEVLISELHVICRRPEAVPFTVYENELSKDHEFDEEVDHSSQHQHTGHITDRTRLANRLLDLRSVTSKSIFRVSSGITTQFRSFLDSQGFIEIHTPKLQGGGTESGASVFQVDYFGRPAFLAQSPQLGKQMCIAADFERVYEIGPVFRAENSNTHRHLTEYTGLDLEMTIEEHYHEALDLIDNLLKSIFQGVYDRYRTEIDIIKHHFPHEDLVWLKETPKIPFAEAIQLLNDSGWRDENGKELPLDEDLGTRDEIHLGEVIKKTYNTDYYILDKFPKSARPFYTMPDPHNPKITNSFDIFVRGQEIISGGQRIHDAKLLLDNMDAMGVDPNTMKEYIDGFKYAAPPHAGCGIGLERILMLILNLGNIRFGSLFPRDPKSLPPPPPKPDIRHLESSTLEPPWGEGDAPSEEAMQPLENLVANYGDSTNTSWFDDRYLIWRHKQTGAAVCYVPIRGYAILPGDALCDISQYTNVAATFLKWLKKEKNLKPIWLLVGHELEAVLGEKFGWKTLTCVAEERVNALNDTATKDHDVARKIRRAEKEGVKIIDIDEGKPVPEDVKQKCDARIKEWLGNRKGTQIHLSEITPWIDQQHRRYFYAEDKEGKICAMVVLAQLAPRHGYQVKYSLDFAGAPGGTIEHITLHAIHAAKASGTKVLTFGSAASTELHAVHHMSGARVKVLQNMYEGIVKQFRLTAKSEFRQKLGGEEDPVYVCYPPGGLGVKGSRAILEFFEQDH
ncbi:uncharacterized protein KY384_000436 [Bacidia gigantensis]|uniref:uncharacterized protein n=1 Tax=Bacidia gigantensis TaxID=2732470 RepID=UPI001D0487FD|nr:uncharacterized protein KY384_000436 [Bacidia gigantensis]KAG8525676.1 hypothetical protein KY384_000436 [Bacidia gigantensis]